MRGSSGFGHRVKGKRLKGEEASSPTVATCYAHLSNHLLENFKIPPTESIFLAVVQHALHELVVAIAENGPKLL